MLYCSLPLFQFLLSCWLPSLLLFIKVIKIAVFIIITLLIIDYQYIFLYLIYKKADVKNIMIDLSLFTEN